METTLPEVRPVQIPGLNNERVIRGFRVTLDLSLPHQYRSNATSFCILLQVAGFSPFQTDIVYVCMADRNCGKTWKSILTHCSILPRLLHSYK